MKTVIIDNYDSFTYNLAHLVRELSAEVSVLRNDQFALPQLEQYAKIILSPGPGIPSEAGLLCDVIRTYAGRKPILGVCLGHQAIGEVFGARLENLSDVFHGVATPCHILGSEPDGETAGHTTNHENGEAAGHTTNQENGGETAGHNATTRDALFSGLERDITVGRYHSWVVAREGLPDCLEVTAVSDEGQIMALRHRELDVRGIQFHPESVLTPDGRQMLQNWLQL